MKKLMKLVLMLLIALAVLMSAYSVKATSTDTTGEEGEETPGTSTETPGEGEDEPTTGGDEQDPPAEDDEDEEKPAELEWTDETKVEIKIEANKTSSDTKGTIYNLVTKGLKSNNANTYIYVSVGTKPKVVYGNDGKPNNANFRTNSDGKYFLNNLLALNGKIYVTVVETQLDSDNNWTAKEIIKARELERPALAKVGTRMQAYFLSSKTSVFVWEPMITDTEERRVNIKVGTVTDKEILKAIKNGEANCLERLLAYSKTAPSIYKNTVPVGESASIVNKMNLNDGGYYYVYFELENTDGKYLPLEDVSLYQAQVTSDSELNFLVSYLDSEFVWNLDKEPEKPADKVEEPKKDDTTIPDKKLPQTGQTLIGLGIGGTILALGIVFAVKSKKYSV